MGKINIEKIVDDLDKYYYYISSTSKTIFLHWFIFYCEGWSYLFLTWQTCRGNRAHQAPLLLCYSICFTGWQNLHGLDVGQQHAALLSAHQFWLASADLGGRIVQLLLTRCGMFGFRCQHLAVEVVPACICLVLRNSTEIFWYIALLFHSKFFPA